MQKAEAQHQQKQNQPAQRKGGNAALESPQGEQIVQLEAMVDNSPQVNALMQAAGAANNSPIAAAQRQMMGVIHSSPRAAAQRQQLDSIAGETAQRTEAFIQPSGPIQLSGREGDEDPGPGQGETAPLTPRPKTDEQAPPPPTVTESQIQDGYSPRAGEERDDTAQLKEAGGALQPKVTQRAAAEAKPNNTGLPDNLKSGIESLSGMSMDNVKVHYNSSQPAQLNAHAYAQGTDIHVAPGQEQHLPHEAWHVVQQAQGRVRPTMQMKEGVPVNDDAGLEHEADVMGAKAVQMRRAGDALMQDDLMSSSLNHGEVVQKIIIGKESIETDSDLAAKLGITRDKVIKNFNDALGKDFAQVDSTRLGKFLSARTQRIRGVSTTETVRFFNKLAGYYKAEYFRYSDTEFNTNLDLVAGTEKYNTLMDPQGINYAEGADDGVSVGDDFNDQLACSLFAVLMLKPGFLGASNARELHHVFRSDRRTREYDDDKLVAQIRLAAGLNYRQPGDDENTVGKFMDKVENKGKKFIIDPAGEAHTFSLVHQEGNGWKKFDNSTVGSNPSQSRSISIRLIWTV